MEFYEAKILKKFCKYLNKGAFKNHVDKEGWVGGQPTVHGRPRGVGRWSLLCPCGHFVLSFINDFLLLPRGPKMH